MPDAIILLQRSLIFVHLCLPLSCISIVLFLRREECVSEYLSEIQWNYIKEHEKSPEDVELFIDVAFMVRFLLLPFLRLVFSFCLSAWLARQILQAIC